MVNDIVNMYNMIKECKMEKAYEIYVKLVFCYDDIYFLDDFFDLYTQELYDFMHYCNGQCETAFNHFMIVGLKLYSRVESSNADTNLINFHLNRLSELDPNLNISSYFDF